MLGRKAKLVLALGGLVLLAATAAWCALSANDIITRALTPAKGIRDYTATVQTTYNIPGTDLPTRTAKVYVKLPDKVYVESKGLVVLPKEALLLGNLSTRIKQDSKLVLGSTYTGADHKTIYFLKIIPKESHRAERALVWVEGKNWTLTKTELWRGKNMMLRVVWQFQRVADKYWLPSRLVCNLPGGAIGDSQPGTVTITFTNCRINTGLTDDFFKQKGQG